MNTTPGRGRTCDLTRAWASQPTHGEWRVTAKGAAIRERDRVRSRVFRVGLIVLCLSAVGGFVQPPAAAAAIAFVQVNAATPQTPQTTVAVTYPAAQTAGNLNVVVVGWNDAIRSVATITDTQNHVYLPAVGPTVNTAGGITQTIYYAKNITGAPAGGNTVTVTFNGPAIWADIRILDTAGRTSLRPWMSRRQGPAAPSPAAPQR